MQPVRSLPRLIPHSNSKSNSSSRKKRTRESICNTRTLGTRMIRRSSTVILIETEGIDRNPGPVSMTTTAWTAVADIYIWTGLVRVFAISTSELPPRHKRRPILTNSPNSMTRDDRRTMICGNWRWSKPLISCTKDGFIGGMGGGFTFSSFWRSSCDPKKHSVVLPVRFIFPTWWV